MRNARKDRTAFRPSLEMGRLEERLVLSGATALVSAAQTGTQGTLTARQLRVELRQQIQAIGEDFRQYVNTQIAQLYANGTPTAQQLATFQTQVEGALNATTLRVSSLAALLPNGPTVLVPDIQQALLGDQRTSAKNRLEAIIQSDRATRSAQSLQNAIGRQITRYERLGQAFLNVYFAQTRLNQFLFDANGQPVSLQQFLGQQVVNQFTGNLGALAQAFPTVGNAVLFPNGATTATTAAQQAFANQFGNALGLAGMQLASNLQLFPGASSSVIPQLQTGLFGTGTGATSLFSALQGLPTSSTEFGPAVSPAFSGALGGLVGPLNSFFGLPAATNPTLPTGPFTSLFGGPFVNGGNGFLSGFGSGFTGFGLPTTGFDPAFGTGFTGLVGGLLPGFGFTPPSFSPATGTFTGPTGGGF